jgi:hypothetical protein
MEQIAEQIRAEKGVTVDVTLLNGDPAEELLSLGSRLNVDLIVAGSHGHGFLGRIVMGSVSTRLLRGARSSVMIVPPEEPPKDLEAAAAPDSRASTSENQTSPGTNPIEGVAPL